MPCARRLVILALAALVVRVLPAAAQNDTTDTDRLVAALGLNPGAVIGEIGAGGGALTVAMAKVVGPTGHVYSNEISASRRTEIAKAATQAGLQNVTVVESRARDANLPEGCCDALFMRNVYHHFEDPAPMAASLLRSLKPGGRLAVIDFAPGNGREADRPADRDVDGTHGVKAATVARELEAAGFEILRTDDELMGRWFLVLARKPATTAASSAGGAGR